MKIIGIDPGSRFLGIGLLERKAGKISHIHSEVIALKGTDLIDRMKQLWHGFEQFFIHSGIDNSAECCAAIEDGYLGNNIKSADVLSKIRGFSLAAMISRDIDVTAYSPREIKKALTGSGSADKSQIARMVSTLLNIDTGKIRDDESDALAIAYCHALSLKNSMGFR
mgnify:CR=1 FL=1